jgi:aryl-alcohol dehydrogenase-like predicted oxidoreductase
VEDPATVAVLDDAGARIVASSVLAGGLLSGKYAHDRSQGRLAGRLSSPPLARTVRVADALVSRAVALGVPPATLAIAFALANARVASVLFGATTPSQVAQNVAAVELSARLDSSEVDALRNLALDQGA